MFGDLLFYFLFGGCAVFPFFFAYYLARQALKFFSKAASIGE